MTLDRLAIAMQHEFTMLDTKIVSVYDRLDAKSETVHTELDQKMTKEFHDVREDLKRITDTMASKTDLEEAIREIKAERLPERVTVIERKMVVVEKKLGIREHRGTGRMAA